jgi:hypothetical protein
MSAWNGELSTTIDSPKVTVYDRLPSYYIYPTEAASLHYAATVGFRTETAYGRSMSAFAATPRSYFDTLEYLSDDGEGGEWG